MHEVAAGWLMASLSPEPIMVAFVQSAVTLPMFLLAIPAGALADVVDRRRYLIVTQSWMMVSAAAMAYLSYTGHLNAYRLIFFTFTLGIGSALNSPGWHSVTPEIVARRNLAGAVALNGMAINGARAIGPAIGGALLVKTGASFAFLVNAISFLGTVWILVAWRRKPRSQNAPAERFVSAIRVGVQYALHSPWLKALIVRSALFIALSCCLWSLLPLLVKKDYGLGPTCYGSLMALFGIGAVLGGTQVLPRLRTSWSITTIVNRGWFVFSLCLAALSFGRDYTIQVGDNTIPWLSAISMLLAGSSWLTLLSSFHLTVQSGSPSWARARVMSVYIWSFFGAATFGSAIWGWIAGYLGCPETLRIASGALVVGLVLTYRLQLVYRDASKLQPSGHWEDPTLIVPIADDHGPMLITVEYEVDPEDASEFRQNLARLKQFRMQNGVLRWGVFVDIEHPTRYREVYMEESWGAHLRHHKRVTQQEEDLAQQVYRLHRGPEGPKVTHLALCDEFFPGTDFDMAILLQQEWSNERAEHQQETSGESEPVHEGFPHYR
jgi:MFS family permease